MPEKFYSPQEIEVKWQSRWDASPELYRASTDGEAAFGRLLNDLRLQTKAFILETPVDEPGDDRRNLDKLKELCRKSFIVPKK